MLYTCISFFVDSGLGYVVGSAVAAETNDWRWALRVSIEHRH